MEKFSFEKEYNKLNIQQKQAVDSIYGPIMVVAGPGTGKTQIIGLRTANILKKTDINPENILITTFTEAGVIAIKKRLTNFIGTDAYKVKISTIHSFAQDIITTFPEKFIEQKAQNTIDDIESLEILTQILDENIKNEKIEFLYTPFDRYYYLRDIKDRIGKLKGEGINPQKFQKIIKEQEQKYNKLLEDLKTNKRIRDLEKRTKKDSETYQKHIGKLNELNYIYKIYNEKLKEKSLYDFSDMINFVVEKLKTDEDLRLFYAEKYQFIMLDEYQDTNNPQNEIMDLILKSSEDQNMMVVGDDDQSIYRFQGANIENMLDFYTKYPKTTFIVLQYNYRSSQSILNLSSNLIKNNNERLVNRLDFLDKQLIAQSEYKNLDINKSYILQDSGLEKVFILEDIKKKNYNSKKETFAIIVRSNREVEDWTNFMLNQNIDIESKLKTNILNNDYVNFILNTLKIIENPNLNDEILLDIIRSDIVDIENIDILTIAREVYKINYSKKGFQLTIWEYIQNIDIFFSHSSEEQIEKKQALFEINLEEKFKSLEKIINFRDFILECNSVLGLNNINLLFQNIIDKLHIVEYIENNGSFSDLEDIFTLFNKIKSILEKNNDISLKQLLNKFDLHKKYKISIARQILKKSHSNIEILTAHSSKGLEYDYVYIAGSFNGNWNSKKPSDKLKLPIGVVGQGLQFSNLTDKEFKTLEKEISLEEDRRLFFVAITRAKKEVIFTRPAGKDNKPFIDSPFLIETGIETQEINLEGDWEQVEKSIKNELKGNSLIKTNNEELNYISEFLENYKLSPTDLNKFLEDPKIFLKDVIFKYPFTGNEFTIFGNVYHKVLEIASNKKILNEEISLDFLIETFKFLLNKQILTSEEKSRLIKKGIEGLTGYYKYFIKNPREILEVEYNFRPRDVIFENVKITGKIDKIEKKGTSPQPSPLKEREQATLFIEDIAIIDYKTGKIKTENQIKGIDKYGNKKTDLSEGKYYRQLLFYKLLAENDLEFNSRFNITELALDFVEGKNGEYKYIGITPNQEDFEEFKILVKESWEKINSLDFWREVLEE